MGEVKTGQQAKQVAYLLLVILCGAEEYHSHSVYILKVEQSTKTADTDCFHLIDKSYLAILSLVTGSST